METKELAIGKGKPGPGRLKGQRNARSEGKEMFGLDSPDRLRTIAITLGALVLKG